MEISFLGYPIFKNQLAKKGISNTIRYGKLGHVRSSIGINYDSSIDSTNYFFNNRFSFFSSEYPRFGLIIKFNICR